jgi:superoxide reductase
MNYMAYFIRFSIEGLEFMPFNVAIVRNVIKLDALKEFFYIVITNYNYKKGIYMNRREALKVAGVTVMMAAVSAEAKMQVEHMNRMEMKPKDPLNMDKGELKHSPQVTIKEKDANGYTYIEITVGQDGIIHPSTPDHWIDFIELYADDKLVGKSILEPEISGGVASFAVKLDNVKVLKAKAGCNLHGIWTTTVVL